MSRLCKPAHSLKSNKLMKNHRKLLFAVSDLMPKLCISTAAVFWLRTVKSKIYSVKTKLKKPEDHIAIKWEA